MSRMLPSQRLRTSAPHPFFLSPSSATASVMSRILQPQRLRRVCSTYTPPTSFIGDGKFHDSSSFSGGYPGCSCTTSSSTISGSDRHGLHQRDQFAEGICVHSPLVHILALLPAIPFLPSFDGVYGSPMQPYSVLIPPAWAPPCCCRSYLRVLATAQGTYRSRDPPLLASAATAQGTYRSRGPPLLARSLVKAP